jgi:hypothetical protein
VESSPAADTIVLLSNFSAKFMHYLYTVLVVVLVDYYIMAEQSSLQLIPRASWY